MQDLFFDFVNNMIELSGAIFFTGLKTGLDSRGVGYKFER